MILLDGKKVAGELKNSFKKEIQLLGGNIRLAIVLVGENAASRLFIRAKEKFARDIGCAVRLYRYNSTISTTELRKRLARIMRVKRNTGFVVQLPLPKQINTDYILNAIFPEKDIDMLSSRSMGDFIVGRYAMVPPIVGAIKTLLAAYNVSLQGKHVVVVGGGRLVGKPIAVWLMNEGVKFTLVTDKSGRIAEATAQADILITGTGSPRLITSSMVKEGAVVVDAGTSEDTEQKGGALGKTVGDVDFEAVAPKTSYITPVPGGVGPLTVAMIFQNLLTLARRKK